MDCAFNGKEALDYLDAAEYDLLIVDIMMPEMDGLTLVKKLRDGGSRVPVLFLTALDSTQDKVTGLDSGGDDYLVKPFEFDELLARIRSLLRRSNAQQTARTRLTLADLTLDTRTHQVTRGGQEIALTPKEFSVLDYLLRNQGTVLSREQILEHAWDFSYEGYSNMVDVYIKTLRKKIDKDFEPSCSTRYGGPAMCSKCRMVLGRRLQQGWKRLKNLPVSLRVTLWYTLFLSIIWCCSPV